MKNIIPLILGVTWFILSIVYIVLNIMAGHGLLVLTGLFVGVVGTVIFSHYEK